MSLEKRSIKSRANSRFVGFIVWGEDDTNRIMHDRRCRFRHLFLLYTLGGDENGIFDWDGLFWHWNSIWCFSDVLASN